MDTLKAEKFLTPKQLLENLFKVLDITGCNPQNQTPFRKFLWTFGLSAQLFWLVALIMYNYCCYSGLAALVENIMYISIVIQVIIKFVICRKYGKDLSKLIDILVNEFWTQDDLIEKAKEKYIFVYKLLGIMIKLYRYLFIISVMVIIGETVYRDPYKPVAEVYTPEHIDFNNELPYSLIIFITQLLTVAGCVILVLVPYDSIFILLIGSSYIQFVCIEETLRNMVADENEHESDGNEYKQMKKCVKHHNLILNFLKDVEYVYSLSLMSQLCAILLTICLSIYLITTHNETPVRSAMYATLSVCQLFVYCFGGQIVTDQSLLISDGACECNWWKIENKSFRGAIIMIVQRSQREVKISAGNLFVLSMDLFMTVLRACGSFITLLQSMQD